MKKLRVIVLTLLFVAFGVSGAWAVVVDLYDWGFNIDGTTYFSPDIYSPPNPGQLPGSINVSGFTFSNGPGSGSGFGTITIDVAGAGAHSVIGWFDHEIDESINTWFNEKGSKNGAPDVGQGWELDDPASGNIISHVGIGVLDNINSVPTAIHGVQHDVSMAMGWNFTLASDEWAVITLLLGENVPSSGFYLAQTDPETLPEYTLYFSSALEKQVIPEPGTMLLVGSGVAGLFGLGRKRFKKKQGDK